MLLDGLQRNEVEEVRTQALSQWISREQQQLDEGQQEANVPNPKRHIGETKDKVASAVKRPQCGA